MSEEKKIEIELEELDTWFPYIADYLVDILNGKKTVEEAREDILSFRGSKWYTGTKEEFKEKEV